MIYLEWAEIPFILIYVLLTRIYFSHFGGNPWDPFLANIGFQTQAGWLSLLAEGSLLIPPPVNSTSQPG